MFYYSYNGMDIFLRYFCFQYFKGRVWVLNSFLFFFYTSPILLGYDTNNRDEMVSKSTFEVVAISLIIFGARMNILFIVKVKVLMFV